MAVDFLWSNPPSTPRELVRLYELHVHEAIARGEFEPVVWPHRSFGIVPVIIYFLLPRSLSGVASYARYPVFAFFVYCSCQTVLEAKSPLTHLSYGIGLINAWSVLWLAALMIFNDARTAFKRVQPLDPQSNATANGDTVNGNAAISSSSATASRDAQVRKRLLDDSLAPPNGAPSDAVLEKKYYWQTLPKDFFQRLGWISDLGISFRGAGWAHQILSIPTPPDHILASFPKSTHPVARPTVTEYTSTKSLLRNSWIKFIISYLWIDVLKTFIMRDRYFWGYIDSAPPSHLPDFITSSPILTKYYRLIASLTCVYAALQGLFSLEPLVFVGSPFSRVLGVRAEPWAYPAFFGHASYVLTKGLTGWWGAWWHQMFRFGFQAPGTYAIKKLGWDPRSTRGKTLATLVAFACSGALHAAGSYTTIPVTKPMSQPFLFFFSQGLGIVAETAFKQAMKASGVQRRTPQLVRSLATVVWIVAWMYLTGPLLADDFARAGIWLFEPLPVSPLRGLGFGFEGEGWWCWHGRLMWWHRGDQWWKSGIAV